MKLNHINLTVTDVQEASDFLAFLTEWNASTEPGTTAYRADYLLVTARKNGE